MIPSACLTILTPDLEGLAGFYEQAFGLERAFAIGDWLELKGPQDFRLSFRRRSSFRAVSESRVIFGLEARDFPMTEIAIREAGGRIVGGVEEDQVAGVRVLNFEDPEGNSGYLWQMIKDTKGGVEDAS